jgi:hypothetical protein
VLRPTDWATGYKEKPLCNVTLGIRLPSDGDITYILAIAADWNNTQPGNEKRNLITATVASSICNPLDASLAHEAFPMPDETIRLALRAETIQAMFDELERLMVTTEPTRSSATDEEIADLMSALADGELSDLDDIDPSRAARVRRYLKFVLDDLTEAAEEEPLPDAS